MNEDKELLDALDTILDPNREVTKQETIEAFEYLDDYRRRLRKYLEEE